jgi:peptidoglycan hydrolase CwlO-like protein
MNKKIRREIQQLYLQLSEIYEQMEDADEETTEHLMELATAIEYQIINLKAEFCL